MRMRGSDLIGHDGVIRADVAVVFNLQSVKSVPCGEPLDQAGGGAVGIVGDHVAVFVVDEEVDVGGAVADYADPGRFPPLNATV